MKTRLARCERRRGQLTAALRGLKKSESGRAGAAQGLRHGSRVGAAPAILASAVLPRNKGTRHRSGHGRRRRRSRSCPPRSSMGARRAVGHRAVGWGSSHRDRERRELSPVNSTPAVSVGLTEAMGAAAEGPAWASTGVVARSSMGWGCVGVLRRARCQPTHTDRSSPVL